MNIILIKTTMDNNVQKYTSRIKIEKDYNIKEHKNNI